MSTPRSLPVSNIFLNTASPCDKQIITSRHDGPVLIQYCAIVYGVGTKLSHCWVDGCTQITGENVHKSQEKMYTNHRRRCTHIAREDVHKSQEKMYTNHRRRCTHIAREDVHKSQEKMYTNRKRRCTHIAREDVDTSQEKR